MSFLLARVSHVIKPSFRAIWIACALVSSQFFFFPNDFAYSQKIPPELEAVQIKEHIGEPISLKDATFNDEAGNPVQLSQFFKKGRPVILALVYYECPNLCNFMMNGLLTSLKKERWTVGKEFEIVNVSINPREKSDLAKRKKEAYLRAYGRVEASQGWHLLTGSDDQIKKLAKEVGFGYRYDSQEKQYAHGSVIFVLTPEGIISRYLYGIEYPNKDLRLALLEASNGKIGSVVDRMLLFCYRYDPTTRKYSIYLTKLMQAGSAATVIIFGIYLLTFWRRQRKGAYSNV